MINGRRLRLTGWTLFAVVLIAWASVGIGAAHISEGEAFDRVVGLANVYAAVFGALALLLVIFDRIQSARVGRPAEEALREAESSLARAVQQEERTAFTYLLGTGRKDAHAVDLPFRLHGTDEVGSLLTVLDTYQREPSGRLLITGGAGTGKTVLATYLLLELLKNRSQDGQVPVRIGLSTYDLQSGIDAWLARQLVIRFDLDDRIAAELVARRRILPVLDGLDEVATADRNTDRSAELLTELNTYLRDHDRAPMVVTCRVGPEDPGPALAARRIDMLPLDAKAVTEYLREQAADDPTLLATAKVVASQLNGAAADPTTRSLAHTLRTPWLLTLALTACRVGMAPSDLVPRPGTDETALTNAVERQLLAHYLHATSTLHGSEYDPMTVSRWLRTLAAHLKSQQRQGGSGTDILLHTWWPSAGRRRIRALHGLLGALAVVAGILAALTAFVGPGSVVLDRPARFMSELDRLEPAFGIAASIVVLGAVALPWLAARAAGQPNPQPSRTGLRHLRYRSGRRQFAAATVIGVVSGLAGGLVVGTGVGLGSGLSVGLTFGLRYGAVTGAIVGTAFGMTVGLRRGTADAVTPRQIIRGDLLHGLTYGLLVGAAGGLAGAMAVGPIYGLVVGVGTGLVYGVAIGPVASARYVLANAVNALAGRAPWRLHSFLEWAADAGVLRLAGLAYQFRHSELQHWFATTTPEADYRTSQNASASSK